MIEPGNSGLCAHCNRVVATQRDGKTAVFHGLVDPLGGLAAGGGNLIHVLRAPVAKVLLLGNAHVDVAAVFHLVAQRLESGVQPRRAHG